MDDFSLACKTEALARRIYDVVGKRLQLEHEEAPPLEYLGLLSEYNGVDISQTRDYISVSCSRYIERILRTHGWSTPGPKETDTENCVLMTSDILPQLYKEVGPAEGTAEHAATAAGQGFAYRTLLGELLYAYITCRPDIGYAVTTLSKFAVTPSKFHYTQLKNVARYLRRTINWGIIYTKTIPDPSMPVGLERPHAPSRDLPVFPRSAQPDQLVGYVDAAHVNDLRNRRSTTGYAFVLCGGAVSYRTKTQSITATSSTEAEFLAAVLAAKQAKYLRAILKELQFEQLLPTPIHEDNMSAIKMVNALGKLTIQDWKDNGDIVTNFIPGVINPADVLTKPLGCVLHARHARRIMGHYV